MVDRAAIRAGVRDVSPLLLGVAPFGLVAGVAAVEAGFPPVLAVAMSMLVFAGAAQLALIDLIGQGGSPVVAAATALIVNLRYLMYSASIAPQFREYVARWRALFAYLLTDQVYALTIVREGSVRAYYLGAAVAMWVVYQVTTVAGVALGASIPPEWQLSFAVPLTFLALLVPAVEGRPTLAAALVGGVVATVGVSLPFNAGLLVGALAGIAAGAAVALRTEPDPIGAAPETAVDDPPSDEADAPGTDSDGDRR